MRVMATAEIAKPRIAIKHILIATDLSHQSYATVSYGMGLARLFGAQTEVAYVLPTEEYAMAGPDGVAAGRDAARRDLIELQSRLRSMAAYNDDSPCRAALLEGPVAECLLQCACEKRADLLVVGTHGRGSLGKVFLGSVAEQVFRHSPVPVLTEGPHVHRSAKTVAIRHILAPCDLTPRAHEAVHCACDLATQHGAQLTVLHVVEGKGEGTKVDPQRVTRGIHEELQNIVGDDARGLDVRYEVRFGRIASGILDVAEDMDADMIVLGVRRSSGALDRFQWPVAYELVREASCPVLTIRGSG